MTSVFTVSHARYSYRFLSSIFTLLVTVQFVPSLMTSPVLHGLEPLNLSSISDNTLMLWRPAEKGCNTCRVGDWQGWQKRIENNFNNSSTAKLDYGILTDDFSISFYQHSCTRKCRVISTVLCGKPVSLWRVWRKKLKCETSLREATNTRRNDYHVACILGASEDYL